MEKNEIGPEFGREQAEGARAVPLVLRDAINAEIQKIAVANRFTPQLTGLITSRVNAICDEYHAKEIGLF